MGGRREGAGGEVMRALLAKVAGRSVVVVSAWGGEGWEGGCGGFAAREEALAKGLACAGVGEVVLLEEGFVDTEVVGGLVPKREDPMSGCFCCCC